MFSDKKKSRVANKEQIQKTSTLNWGRLSDLQIEADNRECPKKGISNRERGSKSTREREREQVNERESERVNERERDQVKETERERD